MNNTPIPVGEIQLPDDVPVFSWTLQDIIYEVYENYTENCTQKAEREILRKYLREMTPDQRRRITCLIFQNIHGYWSSVGDMIADLASETYQQMLRIAQGQEQLPELDSMDQQAVNRLRLQRNLLNLTLEQAISSAGPDTHNPDLPELLLHTTSEEQDTVEQAIQDTLHQHHEEILALRTGISQTLTARLEQALTGRN